MMATDQRQHVAEPFEWAAYLLAAHRVGFHHLPLLCRQTARLKQNRVRYSDLPDVVQITAEIDRHQTRVVETHGNAECDARECQALAVSGGMTVPLLHNPGQR